MESIKMKSILKDYKNKKHIYLTLTLDKNSKIYSLLKSNLDFYCVPRFLENGNLEYEYLFTYLNKSALPVLNGLIIIKDLSDILDKLEDNILFNTIEEIENSIGDIDYISIVYNKQTKLAFMFSEDKKYILSKNSKPIELHISCFGKEEYLEILPKVERFNSLNEIVDYIEEERDKPNFTSKSLKLDKHFIK